MDNIDHIMGPGGTREPWLLLLDVCPFHVSKQYWTMVRDRYEHVRLVLAPAGTTPVAQPLDVVGWLEVARRRCTAGDAAFEKE